MIRNIYLKLIVLITCFGFCVVAAEDNQPGLSKSPSMSGAPDLSISDGANVNILSGLPTISQTDNAIGSGVGAIKHTLSSHDAGYLWGFSDNFHIELGYWDNTPGLKVILPGKEPERFFNTPDASGFHRPFKNNGATLRLVQTIGTNKYYEYISSDGTIIRNNQDDTKTVIYPNGLTFYYTDFNQDISGYLFKKYRIVKNNAGYAFAYVYDVNAFSDVRRHFPVKIFGYNSGIDTCNVNAVNCGFSRNWRTSEYTWPEESKFFALASSPSVNEKKTVVVSDFQGIKTFYVHKNFSTASPNNLNLTNIPVPMDVDGLAKMMPRLTDVFVGSQLIPPVKKYEYQNFAQALPSGGPGSAGSNVTQYDIRYLLALKSTVKEQTWTYNHTKADTQWRSVGQANGPYGSIIAIMLSQGGSLPSLRGTIRTPEMEAIYNENTFNLARQLEKDGQKTTFEYDNRGNLTRKVTIGADGVSEAVESSNYEVTCTNIKTCNQPNSITDKNGNTTYFEYHPESGQIQKITYPADRNGVRPETRYSYEQKYAIYKNDSGVLAPAPSPVWMLVKMSECLSSSATTSGCSKAGDEVVTNYDYGPSNQFNNLLVRGITVTAQGVTKRTCYSYDEYGNRVQEIDANARLQSCY